MPLFVNIRGPPNSDFVIGYPGFDSTLPRIAGVVEIRSETPGQTFSLKSLKLQLYRTEVIVDPSSTMRTKKIEKSFAIGQQVSLFEAHPQSHAAFYTVDLPFIYPLPQSKELIPGSLHIHKVARISYRLDALVKESNQAKYDIGAYCPINILRYDMSRINPDFRRDTSLAKMSLDHIVEGELTIDGQSFGPYDLVKVTTGLAPNPDLTRKASKVKITSLEVKLEEEHIFITDNGPVTKIITKLSHKEDLDIPLPPQGYYRDITFPIRMEVRQSRDKALIINSSDGVPNTVITSFTTESKLFITNFYVVVFILLNSSKKRSIELKLPIVITPFGTQTCKDLVGPVQKAMDAAGMPSLQQPPGIFVPAGDQTVIKSTGFLRTSTGSQSIIIE